MNLETIKTFILVILIGISLLLSIVIWNYQPSFDPLNPKYVNEADIGGAEAMKKMIIQPTSILIHTEDQVYGFKDALDRKRAYENVQNWSFSDLSLTKPPNFENETDFIEVMFPLAIPVKIVPNIFQLNSDYNLPNWSFKRMVITVNKSYSTLNIYFMALNGEEAARFVVNDSDAYRYVMSNVLGTSQLTKYMPFGSEQNPIYIQEDEVNVKRRSLAIEQIDPTLLVDALFKNPSLVSHTIGESNYNDGQRGMTVLNDGRSMEFINPIHSKEQISFLDLIDLSITNINEHKGWTNEFILEEVDLVTNRLQYKMYYDGYPVYSHRDYSTIEQQWRDQDLQEYKRPLFLLTNLLNSENVTLPSGEEIVEYLYEHSNYRIEDIYDIRVGYRLIYEEDSFSVVLDPIWYINYNGRWLELRMNTTDLLEKGGS